jgi:hypothetical protein
MTRQIRTALMVLVLIGIIVDALGYMVLSLVIASFVVGYIADGVSWEVRRRVRQWRSPAHLEG